MPRSAPGSRGRHARTCGSSHGYGGLERHVYDLARALGERDIDVTLITPPPGDRTFTSDSIHLRVTADFIPYRTFPLANRRGTTVIDRSTAYPLWGLRAGRHALELVREGRADIVHGFGASVLGYARLRRFATTAGQARRTTEATAPLVMNPQGLEEFGATDPSRAPLKRAAYLPLRRSVIVCARAADAVIATDTSLEPYVLQHLGIPRERMMRSMTCACTAEIAATSSASRRIVHLEARIFRLKGEATGFIIRASSVRTPARWRSGSRSASRARCRSAADRA